MMLYVHPLYRTFVAGKVVGAASLQQKSSPICSSVIVHFCDSDHSLEARACDRVIAARLQVDSIAEVGSSIDCL